MESNKLQDRLKNKVSEQIAEIEGVFDDFKTSWKEIKHYRFLYEIGVRPLHAKLIIPHAQNTINEYELVLSGQDKDLSEGYSNFTKPQLKKMVLWWSQIIKDCETIIQEGKIIRSGNRASNKRKKEIDNKSKKIVQSKSQTKFQSKSN